MATAKKIDVYGVKIKQPYQRLVTKYDSQLKVKSFGFNNLYPYMLQDLIEGSTIGRLCADKVAQFIEGNGWKDEALNDVKANSEQTFGDVLRDLSRSFAYFSGAYIWVGRNGLLEIDSIRVMDFTSMRLGELDSYGNISHFVYCPDWSGKRTTRNKKEIKTELDRKEFLPYTNNIDVIRKRIEIAGGLAKYAGEIIFLTNRRNEYPLPSADSILSYLSADIGYENIVYRSVRSSFMPSTILTVRGGEPESNMAFQRQLESVMGDEASSSICVLQTNGDPETEAPQVTDFHQDNYVNKFQVTREVLTAMIYTAFGLDVYYRATSGAVNFGFSTNVLTSAFNITNMVFASQKNQIERAMNKIFHAFKQKGLLAKIEPLVYNAQTDNNEEIVSE